MNDPDLKRTLQSLACAKYRVLNKEPRGRDVNDTDRFVFNEEFKCPLARFKIAMVANKVETQEELKETREKVEEERRLYTEVRFLIFDLYTCGNGAGEAWCAELSGFASFNRPASYGR